MDITKAGTLKRLTLSPLDQIMPRTYSRIIFPIPISDAQSESALQRMRQGLEATVKDIPFLNGNVVPSPQKTGQLEVEVKNESQWFAMWKVKNHISDESKDVLNLADLRAKSFPLSRLQGDVLAPVSRLPDPLQPAPVMAVQVNVVKGGFLLCVAIHHSFFDGVGFSTVLKRWSSNCISGGNAQSLDSNVFDRGPLMNGRPPGDYDDFKEYKIPKPAINPPTNDQNEKETRPQPPVLPAMKAVILYFSAPSLKTLKEDIISVAAFSSPQRIISTNDSLCALLWWHITLARFPSHTDTNPSQSSLGFPINGRSRCSPPLPPSYVGNVSLYGKPSFPLHLLTDSSVPTTTHLASLASLIRSAISAVDGERIQRVIGLVNELPNPSLLARGFDYFLGPDLAITSWAGFGWNGLRFFEGDDGEDGSAVVDSSAPADGVAWGCVEAVRIPYASFDGLCTILPTLLDKGSAAKGGGLEVVIGLREEDMRRLLSAESGIWKYAESVIE